MRVEKVPQPVLSWLVDRVGCTLTAEARGLAALDEAGRIRGMVAYDGWTNSAVQAHMAVDSAIAWRSLLPRAFSYPFDECGRGVLLGLVRADNPRCLALTRSFGFREAHRIRDGADVGIDLILFEMRRAECRFLKTRKVA